MINTMFQTSAGNFFFDAVFRTEHHASLVMTEHPVQSGASVADHAYMESPEVVVEIGMSDVNGVGRSARMYKQLKDMMESREPFTAVTKLEQYENMLITSMSTPDDYTTMYALKTTLILKQVRIVSVATIQVQQTVSASKSPAIEGSSTDTTKHQTAQVQTQAQPQSQTKASILAQAAQTNAEKKVEQANNAKKATPVKTSKVTLPVVSTGPTSSIERKVSKNISMALMA